MDQEEVLVETSIVADPRYLKRVRDTVRGVSGQVGFSAKVQHKIALAVDEACSNIIRHGYGLGVEGDIEIVILKSERALVFRLHDDAEKVVESDLKPKTQDKLEPGGLGLRFIYEIMDEVHYVYSEQPGNTLEMIKYL